jgi:peptidoglycan/LPS O-acetylase OafA/YrhL
MIDMPERPKKSSKLPALEGLRGLASFAVLIHHIRSGFYAKSFTVLPSHWVIGVNGLLNGTFAVWLFWIMSGVVLSLRFFLHAQEYADDRGHEYLEDASVRRYPRLLVPVAASVIFAWALCAGGIMWNIRLVLFLGEPYRASWLGGCYTFLPDLGVAIKSAFWNTFFDYRLPSYNGVLWTMEMEFYGSLFLFAFLAICGRRRRRVLAYPIVGLVIHCLHLHWLNSFVVGIAVCDVWVNGLKLPLFQSLARTGLWTYVRSSKLFAVLMWVAIVYGAGYKDFHAMWYLLLGTVAVLLTLNSSCTRHLLSTRPLLFLGKISFGLYLIHMPIICSFSCWAYLKLLPLLNGAKVAVIVSLATCVVSIVMGYVLYIVADRPGVNIARWMSTTVLAGPAVVKGK